MHYNYNDTHAGDDNGMRDDNSQDLDLDNYNDTHAGDEYTAWFTFPHRTTGQPSLVHLIGLVGYSGSLQTSLPFRLTATLQKAGGSMLQAFAAFSIAS